MVYKFFDKMSKVSGFKSLPNQQLSNERHKPNIRKFKRRRVSSSFKDNIQGDDLADMQLISNYNKGIRYLLCAIDLFSKYVWVVPLKEKKVLLLLMHFKLFQIAQKDNQAKYGLINVMNFITVPLKMVKRQ